MQRVDVTNKIINFFIEKNIIQSSESFDLNASLVEYYGIDSVSLVEIIICCEEEFGFEFDYNELDLSNFKTLNTLTDVIMKRLASDS